MPDGSVFVYKDTNKNAELTGSDILSQKREKGPDISSASNISIPQKTDLSTDSEEKVSEMRKYDIVDDELNSDGEVKDEYFEKVLKKTCEKAAKNGGLDSSYKAFFKNKTRRF